MVSSTKRSLLLETPSFSGLGAELGAELVGDLSAVTTVGWTFSYKQGC